MVWFGSGWGWYGGLLVWVWFGFGSISNAESLPTQCTPKKAIKTPYVHSFLASSIVAGDAVVFDPPWWPISDRFLSIFFGTESSQNAVLEQKDPLPARTAADKWWQ